jgi:uncharacterized protein involved in exopolysaccharide biosynthesis
MQTERRQQSNSSSEYRSIRGRGRNGSDSREEAVSVFELWSILKRRFYLFSLPAIAIFVVVFVYALNISATYRSEATILIEDQDIPESFIGARMSTFASQQVKLISQRLLTVQNIMGLVEKFDLYEPTDPGVPVSASILADYFREDMELELINESVIDQQGREASASIAFKLAFKSAEPETALQVTEELVTLFLNENERSSISKTTGVTGLLSSAISDANEELLEAEAELATFKANNEGALPELYQLNLNVIDRTERQLSDTNLRLGELAQRRLQLSAQLSSLSPSAPVRLPSGEIVMGDRERLKSLLLDFRRKSAVYQAGHPDLVRLEREIESLRRTVGGAESYALLQEQLQQERDRLSALMDRYSDDHPDIKRSEATISSLEAQLAETDPQDSAFVGVADNPAYVLVNTQLQATDLEVDSLTRKRRELQAVIAEHEELIRKAPLVEMQYGALLREYENAKKKHEDLQARLRAVEVSSGVEQEFTGRRFTVIEPPVLPIDPEARNRLTFLFLGFLLAVAVGAGCVVIAEFLDDSIRSSRDMVQILGAAPLAVIPYLDNEVDQRNAIIRRSLVGAAFITGTALLIAYVIYTL